MKVPARDALRPIDPEELGRPRGYSNGMLAPAGWRPLFVAGQIGWDSHQQLVAGGFVPQFRQALGNVLTVVRAAGGTPEHLAQLTLYVVDKAAYAAALKEVGAVYRELMGTHYPAMALVEVSGLLEPGAEVEIQAVATLPA